MIHNSSVPLLQKTMGIIHMSKACYRVVLLAPLCLEFTEGTSNIISFDSDIILIAVVCVSCFMLQSQNRILQIHYNTFPERSYNLCVFFYFFYFFAAINTIFTAKSSPRFVFCGLISVIEVCVVSRAASQDPVFKFYNNFKEKPQTSSPTRPDALWIGEMTSVMQNALSFCAGHPSYSNVTQQHDWEIKWCSGHTDRTVDNLQA